MFKQVEKSHYDFGRYMDKRRWASVWHQVDEVIKLASSHVLEIGPGPGVFKAVMGALGVSVETLDIDPDLRPDYMASVFEMPFGEGAFDTVCAFQMLEHLPFEKSLCAFREMVRVASRNVVISLPDAAKRLPISIYIPMVGTKFIFIPFPSLFFGSLKFDGQHYWEVSRPGFSRVRVGALLAKVGSVELVHTFRVPEYPYHRFFVFRKHVDGSHK